MGNGTPKLLLVSHPDKAQEIVLALNEQGLGTPVVGAGGDETLDRFEESSPDVVIMVAGLAEGDVPSLAAAIQSGQYGRPAPIVLLVGEGDGLAVRDAQKNKDFAAVLTRPFLATDLAAAITDSSKRATGARMSAAMDLAIESFVADAMVSLGQGLVAESASGDGAMANTEALAESATGTPAYVSARARSWQADTALLRSSREPTEVLDGDSDASSPLSPESKALLDAVLPGETLDVDLDELDAVDRFQGETSYAKNSSEARAIPEPPGGGDFARQLRQKMSAMAERLFPGQREAEQVDSMAPINAAHTEIDLGAIEEAGAPVDTAEDGYPGSSVGPDDSDIAMARDSGHPSSGSALTRPRASGAAAGQALVGNLDSGENDIAAILARLWKREFSGCLVLVRGDEEKRVHFEKGRVVFASSTQEADRMGELLLRQGKITTEQLVECREQVKATGRRLGEVLVDQGHLKPRELLPAVRQHLEDIVYSVFAWTSGSYDALPEQTTNERIRLASHPAALIVEGIRRKYDRQRLESCLGGMGHVLVTVKGDELAGTVAAADLSEPESDAHRYFDGEHTLEDVSAESQLGGLRVAQLAYAWLCLGVAELVERSSERRTDRGVASGYLVGETDLAIDRQRVRAKHLLVQEADYFQLLGVRPDASGFEIRRAYESARRQFGVENFPPALQEELRPQLEEIESVIEEAYLVLSDDGIRSKYRANLR